MSGETTPAAPVAPGGVRDTARRLLGLIRHDVLQLRRDPGPVVSRLCMPVLLMVVFEPFYRAVARVGSGTAGGSAIADTAPRVLVTFSLFAISTVGTALLTERTWRTWSWLRTTSASTAELLVGKLVPLLGLLAVQQALVLGVARAVYGLRVTGGLLLLAAAGLCWALCVLACGALAATFARTNNQLSSITDLSGLLLSAVGGALVPVSLMPAWLRTVSPFSPAYWGVRALQGALLGRTGPALTACALLLLLTAVLGTLACWRINRSWAQPELL